MVFFFVFFAVVVEALSEDFRCVLSIWKEWAAANTTGDNNMRHNAIRNKKTECSGGLLLS